MYYDEALINRVVARVINEGQHNERQYGVLHSDEPRPRPLIERLECATSYPVEALGSILAAGARARAGVQSTAQGSGRQGLCVPENVQRRSQPRLRVRSIEAHPVGVQ